MTDTAAALPPVVSREQWRAARKALLIKEKALTRARDELNAERRRLPMVRIANDYIFEGPTGPARLLDLFDGHAQLIVGHFMFDPEWDEGCPSRSAGADEFSAGHLSHLLARSTSFAYVSRAPYRKIEAYRAKKGWTVPWYSSFGSDFNYDFHVTIDESVTPAEYNFRTRAEHEQANTASYLQGPQPFELNGLSCFLRVDDDVFHTYSLYARGTETVGGAYYFLDLTALGRQEDWEEPAGRARYARSANPNFSA
ncbi:DUF899 domain-containing protein [Pseudonocardia sp. DSM 110487]|uniref:DUF899 domain-containing protein n=1 Tax=Pseudonocardia sp. DSM 110487 TaxID=2865833 RepID=UPI0021060936|nr:DUF899 domain-containing protein [Pseudonocardia sp. DSM 110487]